jgi:hypothetical protein
MKIIYEHNDEQHARHVAEHEKPAFPEQSTSGAQRKAKKESMKVASIGGD